MTIHVPGEQDILQDAVQVLLEYLKPEKFVRFWSAWQKGGGDYLLLREQLFQGETTATLFEKVKTYQADRKRSK